jgi:hypothetical protein
MVVAAKLGYSLLRINILSLKIYAIVIVLSTIQAEKVYRYCGCVNT